MCMRRRKWVIELLKRKCTEAIGSSLMTVDLLVKHVPVSPINEAFPLSLTIFPLPRELKKNWYAQLLLDEKTSGGKAINTIASSRLSSYTDDTTIRSVSLENVVANDTCDTHRPNRRDRSEIRSERRFLEEFPFQFEGRRFFQGEGELTEFKLDELIDVAERVGAPERPTSWPTCASSIVDFNSTVVASNANYLTSTFQRNRNPSMISRTRSSNFLPFSAPQRYSIIDHRGMNSSKIARKIVIEINGICKFVSTIHESSNNSLSSTNNNVNNYKFVSNKWIEQNRWKSNAFAHYQLFMIVITFRKNKLSYNFDQWIFKWLASIGALIRAA